MIDSAARWRVLRATVFAMAAVVLAVSAHVVGGGAAPGLAAAAAAVAITVPVALLLARRVRGAAVILGVLAGVQAALHELFMTAEHARSMLVDVAPGGAMPMVHAAPLMPVMAADHVTTLPMLAGHGAAVLITALLLARGEAVLLSLLALMGSRPLPRLLAVPVLPALVVGLPSGLPARVVRPGTSVRRRGPPRVSHPLLICGTH